MRRIIAGLLGANLLAMTFVGVQLSRTRNTISSATEDDGALAQGIKLLGELETREFKVKIRPQILPPEGVENLQTSLAALTIPVELDVQTPIVPDVVVPSVRVPSVTVPPVSIPIQLEFRVGDLPGGVSPDFWLEPWREFSDALRNWANGAFRAER